MYIHEHNLITDLCESILDHLDYIEEPFHPVNVRIYQEDSSNLIDLKDFHHYLSSNSINDIGYGLAQIAEANNIPLSSIGFLVEDTNLLAYSELISPIVEHSTYPIYVLPLSNQSPRYKRLDEAFYIDRDSDFEQSSNLQKVMESMSYDDTMAYIRLKRNTLQQSLNTHQLSSLDESVILRDLKKLSKMEERRI